MIGSLAAVAGIGAEPESQWSYTEAFARHRGLLAPAEQERLQRSRVAIAGQGGVGGVHLATLARLGIGSFHIADPDCFELVNFNRQYGATTRTLGQSKATVMAEHVRTINPELDLRIFSEAVTAANVSEFLDGVDVLVDGIDFFALPARRMVFREARRRGIWAVTAGPIGFSTAWLAFSPSGMSFDEYFDLHDGMDPVDQLIAFLVGLTPRATQWTYMNQDQVKLGSGRGPSSGLACQLCAGVVAAEVVKILLQRSGMRPAPWYFQFDAYRQVLRSGRLFLGNRHPWQRLKRWWLKRRCSG